VREYKRKSLDSKEESSGGKERDKPTNPHSQDIENSKGFDQGEKRPIIQNSPEIRAVRVTAVKYQHEFTFNGKYCLESQQNKGGKGKKEASTFAGCAFLTNHLRGEGRELVLDMETGKQNSSREAWSRTKVHSRMSERGRRSRKKVMRGV